MSHSESHAEFLELCAVATSGALSEKDRARLQDHLTTCPSCREAMCQYQQAIGAVIPALAPADFPENLQHDANWSERNAERSFFARLKQEEDKSANAVESDALATSSSPGPRTSYANGGEAIWRHVWLQYAAGVLLMAGLGFGVYQVGVRHGSELSSTATAAQQNAVAALEQQLSDVSHERELAQAEDVRHDKTVVELRKQLTQQTAEVSRLKATQAQMESAQREDGANRARLAQERANLAQQLATAQAATQSLQIQLNSASRQASHDSARTVALEVKVNELTRAIRGRDQDIDQQRQLLARDRDIRELMGARDLYIAEVYDVARTGTTQKPFGRIFYTKGKSLIFYAYDLDQQSGVKNASTFQAWGRRGPDPQHAISLGIFYQDSAAKKRWVMKSDNPKTLSKIDAVFVTVEPHGGSHVPSGKRLLFAYLHIKANHP